MCHRYRGRRIYRISTSRSPPRLSAREPLPPWPYPWELRSDWLRAFIAQNQLRSEFLITANDPHRKLFKTKFELDLK